MNMSPVANSGNAQNHIGVQPGGGDVDNGGRYRGKDRDQNGGGNVEFNDVNSRLDVSGGRRLPATSRLTRLRPLPAATKDEVPRMGPAV